jgi:hypothetical protein
VLWYIGSSQSKESDDRLEEKIDLLIQRLDSEKGKWLFQGLDKIAYSIIVYYIDYSLDLLYYIIAVYTLTLLMHNLYR